MAVQVTIVSAFYPALNITGGPHMAWGQQLIDVPTKKIIFTTQAVIEQLKGNEDTLFVPFEFEFPDFLDDITLPMTRNFMKDTAKFLWLMNNKLYFCKKAIAMNPFHTSQFVWLDFGLVKVCHESTFKEDILRLVTQHSDRVRIAHIWRLQPAPSIHNCVEWFFAGGVFGGDAQTLLEFADAAEQELLSDLANRRLTWEVNLWWRVYMKRPELFSPYKCGHNVTIITSY